MMSANESLRCPLFEGSQFTYAAFQVEPQSEELMGMIGGPVTTRFAAIGTARFEQVECAVTGVMTSISVSVAGVDALGLCVGLNQVLG